MEPYNNMAATSHVTPSEKPEVFGYYFQIPENAEVKRVPISMLSSSVQKRIKRCTDLSNASYVIVVSPITKQKFPNSHIAKMTMAKEERSQVSLSDAGQSSDIRASTRKADKWMRKDHETYLVPMKCCKDIALTILQMSQTSNGEQSSSESELPNASDSLILNLQVIKMKATALCMYKNMMYLLPESIMKDGNNGKGDCQEKVETFEATKSQSGGELSRNSQLGQNGLGCETLSKLSFLQPWHDRLEDGASAKSASGAKLQNEVRWDRPAEKKSTDASPSSRPSTENDLQVSFGAHSGRRMKRKLPYIGNRESLIKNIHLSGSAKKQDSPAKNAFTHSHLSPHLPSSRTSSSVGRQESPPSSSSTNADHEVLYPSGLLCGTILPMASASLTPDPNCGDHTSPPWLNAKSSPCLSGFSTSSEDSHKPDASLLHLEPVSSQSLSGSSTSSGDSHEPDDSRLCLKAMPSPSLSGFSPSSGDSHEPDDSRLCLKPMSSPSLSGFSTSSEDNHEPDETSPSGESPLMNHSQSELACFPDIDETTRDERAQRLLDRVRECEKIVEDMRQKGKTELEYLSNISDV